jgi:hypothetical protein
VSGNPMDMARVLRSDETSCQKRNASARCDSQY